jgi:importin subunit beta-1
VVSVEDKLTLEEMQTSLTSVIMAIVQRLEAEIKPQADRIMAVLLQLLSAVGTKSSVPDTVFAAIGALANAQEEDFIKYMDAFTPFLYNALSNQEEPALCSMAIGLVSDITRSLGEKVQPWCDAFMNYLLNNLRVSQLVEQHTDALLTIQQSQALGNTFKPAILQCFGDIAQSIGGHFDTYLAVVAQVLQQASGVPMTPDISYEMLDYIVSLREGIMDAWDGAIVAMKSSGKSKPLYSNSSSESCCANHVLQRHCSFHTYHPSSNFSIWYTRIPVVRSLSCALHWELLGKQLPVPDFCDLC